MTPEQLASQGYTVNIAATPHGCCASILSVGMPYQIYRCSHALSMGEAFRKCVEQMKKEKRE